MSQESTPEPAIKISHTIPPVYLDCVRHFGVSWDRGVVITYGDTVYCKYDLTPDLIVHEAVHIEQQTRMGKEEWWKKYFSDAKFRLEQETAAYIQQARYIRATYARPTRRRMFARLAGDMVRMYGGMCSLEQAESILKNA